MTQANPTAQAYGDLNKAYAIFNERLFGGTLPGCLITFQRRNGCYGYFSSNSFKHRDEGEITDEIALNPTHFASRPPEKTLSTLVHEMVHLWQFRFGSPSRGGYHNKEWAAKMREVGLIPTDTGGPGGNQTGQNMTHMIQEGGPFATVCCDIIQAGHGIAWVENGIVLDDDDVDSGPTGAIGTVLGGSTKPRKSSARALLAAKKRKVRYTCPVCNVNVWGKPDLLLLCGTDHEMLLSDQIVG